MSQALGEIATTMLEEEDFAHYANTYAAFSAFCFLGNEGKSDIAMFSYSYTSVCGRGRKHATSSTPHLADTHISFDPISYHALSLAGFLKNITAQPDDTTTHYRCKTVMLIFAQGPQARSPDFKATVASLSHALAECVLEYNGQP